MDSQYLQHVRYKLQKRFRRVNAARYLLYHSVLKQFWVYLHHSPVFAGVLETLIASVPNAKEAAEQIINQQIEPTGDEETKWTAVSYWVIKSCYESDDSQAELNIAANFSNETNIDDNLREFTEMFVEPIYEYLDEALDDRGAILALLRKYKQKVEWFQRDQVFKLWKQDTQKGEKNLALHLYEFLHDQGIDFYIEPTSASGEADIISSQEGDERLLADAKIFNAGPDKNKGKAYLSQGIKQLYTYTCDYNEPVGYLIVYKTSAHDLKFALSDSSQSVPCLIFNNKTIYILTIDLYPHTETASSRGRLQPYEITEKDLIRNDEGLGT